MKNIKTTNILLIITLAVIILGIVTWLTTKSEINDGVTSVPIKKKYFSFGTTDVKKNIPVTEEKEIKE
jgi:hypothetical protein